MNRIFYDIESLKNLFTIAFWYPDGRPNHTYAVPRTTSATEDPTPVLEIYALADAGADNDLTPILSSPTFQQRLKERVFERNPALLTESCEPRIDYYDLRQIESVLSLIRVVGVNTRRDPIRILSPENDIVYDGNNFAYDFEDGGVIMVSNEKTHELVPNAQGRKRVFLPGHDTYIMGYNSYNYDTTMLAYYLSSILTPVENLDERSELEREVSRTQSAINAAKRDIDRYKHLVATEKSNIAYCENQLQACQTQAAPHTANVQAVIVEFNRKLKMAQSNLRTYEHHLQLFQKSLDDNTAREQKASDALKRQENTENCYRIDVDGITAADLREFNDGLFSEGFIDRMYALIRYPAWNEYGEKIVQKANLPKFIAARHGHDKRVSKDIATEDIIPWPLLVNPAFNAQHGGTYVTAGGDLPKSPSKATLGDSIRRFWLATGRHIDVARLNEKQNHVGLKRLLGILGLQIFEDEVVAQDEPLPADFEKVLKLLAYNASDVINLRYLFEDGNYRAPFENKAMILEEYRETIFQGDDRSNPAKNIVEDRKHVRWNRLTVDSTSQQIITSALCPNTKQPLPDSKELSLVYPDKKTAEELNGAIQPRDILDETVAFFNDNVLPRITDPEIRALAKRQATNFFGHYEWMRGKNFDKGKNYRQLYNPNDVEIKDFSYDLPGIGTCLLYFNGDGTPSSCYAIISEGGVHGAEYDQKLWEHDLKSYQLAQAVIKEAQDLYGTGDEGALNLINNGVKVISRSPISEPDDPNTPHRFCDDNLHYAKDLLTSNSTKKAASWKQFSAPELFSLVPVKPETKARLDRLGTRQGKPFPKDIRSDRLNTRYNFTSAVRANHDDFSSYYPSLLRNMRAFYNSVLGYDRYGELYEQKQTFGKYQKHPELAPANERKKIADLVEPEQKRYWTRRRNGVKLMLNAGSGAGDASFDNAIRMNNRVIAMRMIGQMFTWRIAQAQTLEGGYVPSTNTDGLYTVMEKVRHNEVLEREANTIGVEIEPEPLMLITKDANNRVEFEVNDIDPTTASVFDLSITRYHILSAGGAELSCYRGPSTATSIAHPALYDWTMIYYLMNKMQAAIDQAKQDNTDEDAAIKASFREPAQTDFIKKLIEYRLSMSGFMPRDGMYVNPTTNTERPIAPGDPTDPSQDDIWEALRDDYNAAVVDVLRCIQQMVASSPSKYSYVIARDIDENGETPDSWYNVQHYNRVFPIKADMQALLKHEGFNTVYLQRAVASKSSSNPSDVAMNLIMEIDSTFHDPTDFVQLGRTATLNKITGFPNNQPAVILNDDLACMPMRHKALLLTAIDIDYLVGEIADKYEKNWRNGNRSTPKWESIIARHDELEEKYKTVPAKDDENHG